MRNELIDYLTSLSDVDYQRSVWVNGEVRDDVVHDELDYAVHFIFDDTCLGSNPAQAIGDILKDENEAKYIMSLVEEMEYIFEKYGNNLSDNEYISKPEWRGVLQAASDAKKIII